MTSTIRAAAQAAVFVGLFVGELSVRGHGGRGRSNGRQGGNQK